MNTDQKQEVLRLTQTMIEGIWNRNFRVYDKVADENITGIGSYETEYVSGKDDLKMQLLRRSAEYPPVYLDGETFQVISDDVNSCVVAGKYDLYAKGHMLKQQRITVLWIIKRRKLKVHHMQFTDVKKDLDGPQHEFTRALRRHKEEQTVIPVRDHEGKLYMLEPADIEWIEAARNYIKIHRADDGTDLKVRAVFTDFIKPLPSQFMIVSRGKAVNLDYVDTFSRSTIKLIDGTVFRVSRSCQDEVEEKMQKIHYIFNDMED